MRKSIINIFVAITIYVMVFLPVSYALTISNETVTPQNSGIVFSWDTNNLSNARVDYGTTPAYGLNTMSSAMTLNHVLTVSGLNPSTTYYYKITSNDSLGYAAEKTGQILTPDNTPPAILANFTYTSKTKNSVTLSWDTSSDSDFKNYALYRNSVNIYNGTAASFTDTNLSSGTDYSYSVSAFDFSGNEGSRKTISVSTTSLDFSSPVIKNITLLESTDTGAKIGWTTDDNSTSIVYYRTSAGSNNANTAGFVKDHKVSISSIEKGKSVYYIVSSCNEDGYCANSSEQGFMGGKDVTPPEITINELNGSIKYYNQETLTLTGKTEGFSEVSVWVNSGFKQSVNADINGTFTLYNIPLDLGTNTSLVRIQATDPVGNKKKVDYTVILKFTVPKIKAWIPDKYSNKTISFITYVDQISDVDINIVSLDNVNTNSSISKSQVGPGNFTIKDLNLLSDKNQKIILTAKDNAGNVGRFEKNILVDTEAPKIESVKPSNGAMFYAESIDDVDISGKTSPNVTVSLWINKEAKGKADKTTISDSSGNFKFSYVDFNDLSILDYIFNVDISGLKWLNDTDIPAKDRESSAALQKWMDGNKFYWLQAENSVGVKTNPPKFGYIKKVDCYSGNLSWTVNLLGEYQTPSSLSVERLNEGTEYLNFVFELKYIGPGTSPKIIGVPQIKAGGTEGLDTKMQTDKKYELTRKVVTGMDFSSKQCNQDKTMCYVAAKPVPIADLTKNLNYSDWTEIFKAMNNELIIPLTFEIQYNYVNDDGKETSTQTQRSCKQVVYAVDNTKIDFSKLPDWLVNDGVKYLNKSIEALDSILKQAKPIVTTVGYVCMGSFVAKTGVTITRKITEKINLLLDKSPKFMSTSGSKCYSGKDGDNTKIKSYFAANNIPLSVGKDNYIDRLSNKDLATCYPGLSKVWAAEERMYQLYRWSCDRIYCHSSPSPWTGKPVLPDDKTPIKGYGTIATYLQEKNYNYSLTCNQDLTTVGAEMKKVDCPTTKEEYKTGLETSPYIGKKNCYIFEGIYWGINLGSPQNNIYELTQLTDQKGGTKFARTISSGQGTLKAVNVKGSDDDILLTARPYTCAQACSGVGYGDTKTKDQYLPSINIKDKLSKGEFSEITIDGQKVKSDTQTVTYPCSYDNQGNLIDKKTESEKDKICDSKIVISNLDINTITLFKSNDNSVYGKDGKCFNYPSGEYKNPCAEDAKASSTKATSILKDKHSLLTDDNQATNVTYKSGNTAGIMLAKTCSEQIATHKSGKNMGVTFGDPNSNGDELQMFLTGNNNDPNYDPKVNPYICCCYSEKEINYDDGYIKPYNNVGTLDGLSKQFNNGKESTTKDDTDNVEIWNYRYSKTGYIYPNTKEIIDASSTDSATNVDSITEVVRAKRDYHPKMYYAGRDMSANFGFNNIIYSTDMDFMDPKTQYTTAFQTLCLTGIYTKLQRLRNILTSVRNCIISVKYTNKYSSDSCKEVFSKYVCSVANDIILAATTGCSPYGSIKTGLFSEESIPAMLGQGVSGMYEGMTDSITDFGKEYDTNQIAEMLGGGTGAGVAHKACMMAFGADWDLSMDSLLDVAYTETSNTDVIPMGSPTKQRLGINPATSKFSYEYKGAINIMPGCDITGWNVDLVCITRGEQDSKRGMSCASPYTCNCLDAQSQPLAYNVRTGGSIKQNTIFENGGIRKTLNDRNYIYDHVKVTLQWDKNKYKNCMPDNHKDGIWYFPIKDNTPIMDPGCQLNVAAGEFRCTTGLTKLLMGNAYIYNVDIPQTIYVGESFKATPNIVKTGEGLMCLEVRVFNKNPGTSLVNAEGSIIQPIQQPLYSQTSSGSIQEPITIISSVPQNWLGSGNSPTITFTTNKGSEINNQLANNIQVITPPTSSKTVTITLSVGSDGKYDYRDDGATPEIKGNGIIQQNGAEVQIFDVTPNEKDREKLKNGGEIYVLITFPQADLSVGNDKNLWVSFEIKQPRTNTSTSCSDATSISSMNGNNFVIKQVSLNKFRTDGEKADPCKYMDGYTKNIEKCACTGTILNCGDSDFGEYCYKDDKTGIIGCKKEASLTATASVARGFGTPKILKNDNYRTQLNSEVISGTGGLSGIKVKIDTSYYFAIPSGNTENIKMELSYTDYLTGNSIPADNDIPTELLNGNYVRSFQFTNLLEATKFYDINTVVKNANGEKIADLPSVRIYIEDGNTGTTGTGDKCGDINGKQGTCKSTCNTQLMGYSCKDSNLKCCES